MVKNYITNNKQESGRSMVEMLGVLAIIGVLSVGGISGYTTAMNKHKANEILNAAAVRAMAVSTQLQSGVTDPTLGEFPTGEEVGGATFGDVTKTGDKFKIGFSLNNDDVLAQIKNIAGTDGIVRGIAGDGLIYNDDLSTEVRASDFDNKGTGEGGCDTSKYTYCSDSGRCLEGTNNPNCSQTCVKTSPECQECTNTGGISAINEGNDCTTSDNKAGTCTSGTCVEKPLCSAVGESCSSNDTCCSGTYCKTSGSCNGNVYTITEGTCESIQPPTPIEGGYLVGPDGSWDASKNYCAALEGNYSLVKITDNDFKKDSYHVMRLILIQLNLDDVIVWSNELGVNQCKAIALDSVWDNKVDDWDMLPFESSRTEVWKAVCK